jgi:type I restriction enzyme M protein
MSDKITLQQLKSYLWESANILRGSIDSGDFKNYILGMLFFKRLNDVYEEEYEKLKDTVGEELARNPDMHTRFFRPDGCSWNEILSTSTNIGEKINDVFAKVTRANSPKLEGILERIDFNDKDSLPDASLSQLVQHFNTLKLGNENISGDMLGQAYEYLIEQFADDAGKKGGEFYTPPMVVKLLVMMLKPHELESIYDPCCGSGGMLIQAAHYLVDNGGDPVKLFMFGQEKNRNTYVISKMNMILHGYDNAHTFHGDTFDNPKHTENGQLKKFDIVLANPPWNQNNWHYEKWKNGDPYNRFVFGLPSKSSGDWAWLQLMYASLKPK